MHIHGHHPQIMIQHMLEEPHTCAFLKGTTDDFYIEDSTFLQNIHSTYCNYILFFFFKGIPFIFIIYLFIHLFLAVFGLRFCARAFSSCGKQGTLFIAMCGPLTIAASLVVEHKLQTRRRSSCGSGAQLLRGMWDLPRPGPKPVSPALADRVSTTVPPGKPLQLYT